MMLVIHFQSEMPDFIEEAAARCISLSLQRMKFIQNPDHGFLSPYEDLKLLHQHHRDAKNGAIPALLRDLGNE